jgi:sulfite dehydrogenase (cytochrome) subunit B
VKLVAFAVFAALVPLVAAAAAPSKVSVTMPGDLSFAFKPGPGSQAATIYCLTCHSSAYVSTQPPLDKAHWAAEVTKMRAAYGATIPDQDAAQIVDYLSATYGKAP